MNEIEKARELQRDCVKSHLIPPILGILKIEKLDKNKNVIQTTTNKSNSYVRNSYNYIALLLLGMTHIPTSIIPLGYENGTYGFKSITGTVSRSNGLTSNSLELRLGTNSYPDVLNDFTLSGNLQNILTSTPMSSTANFVGNVLQVTHTRTFINATSSPVTCAEVGMIVSVLTVRDVFTPVTLNQFEGLTVSYTLEMIFPT